MSQFKDNSNPKSQTPGQPSIVFAPHILPYSGMMNGGFETGRRNPIRPAGSMGRTSLVLPPSPTGTDRAFRNELSTATAQAIISFNQSSAAQENKTQKGVV